MGMSQVGLTSLVAAAGVTVDEIIEQLHITTRNFMFHNDIAHLDIHTYVSNLLDQHEKEIYQKILSLKSATVLLNIVL